MAKKFVLSIAPHVHAGASTNRMMFMVVIALMPAVIASVVIFGLKAFEIYLVTITSCIIFEAVFNKLIGRVNTIQDSSALVTSILLAMTLPATIPLWICVIGSFVAIVIAKMVFGGLGGNPFNPALVARMFLLVSFPVQLTTYITPWVNFDVDTISAATILGSSKTYAQMHDGMLTGFTLPDITPLFLGLNAGALGETCTLAIIIGGVFLLILRVVTWHIPIAFIGTVFLLIYGHNLVHPNTILPPFAHLFSGGLMLGAFFMATDYVTSPLYPMGKIIFGVGCGVLTVVIRIFGGYPEGVAFAILLMNAITPLLDRYLRPRVYGEAVK